MTDGGAWARLELHLVGRPGRGRGAPRRAAPAPRRQAAAASAYHHSVEDTLARVAERRRVAVLMPAPDFDLVDRIVVGRTGCCRRRPRRSSPSRAWACSCGRCSTDDPGATSPPPRPATRSPPPARKNRRRSAPGHLDHVAVAPARHRAPGPGRPTPRSRARRRVCRPRGRVPGDHDPERPQPVAARAAPAPRDLPDTRPTSRTSLAGRPRRSSLLRCHRSSPRRRASGGHRQHAAHAGRACGQAGERPDCGRLAGPDARRDGPGNESRATLAGWPSTKECPAASYSPTASRLQYHRR